MDFPLLISKTEAKDTTGHFTHHDDIPINVPFTRTAPPLITIVEETSKGVFSPVDALRLIMGLHGTPFFNIREESSDESESEIDDIDVSAASRIFHEIKLATPTKRVENSSNQLTGTLPAKVVDEQFLHVPTRS